MMKQWETANPALFDDDVSAVLPRLSRNPLDEGVGSAMYFEVCKSSDTLALSRVFEQMEQPEASLAYCNLVRVNYVTSAACCTAPWRLYLEPHLPLGDRTLLPHFPDGPPVCLCRGAKEGWRWRSAYRRTG